MASFLSEELLFLFIALFFKLYYKKQKKIDGS